MKMKITGTGSSLPREVVSNEKIMEWVETSDEWIKERTGISSRHLSTGETVASLAADACQKALEQAGVKAQEVDMILLATCSPEYLLPCAACQVQEKIGATNAVAFDLNAACSGFLFGLTSAQAYIKSGMYQKILVAGSEVLSKIMDWEDRSSCILFGDGAGAVLVEAVEDEDISGMISFSLGADGSKGMVLSCRERKIENPLYKEKEATTENVSDSEGVTKQKDIYVQMDGQAVYRFATRQVPSCIQDALSKAELTVEDVDLFVLHQANARIIEVAAKRLHADLSKFPMNVDRMGNMSSATIPVLLDELNRDGKIKCGDKLVLSGFGAGLTFGACVISW